MPNLARKSTTVITCPRRLITPFTYCGVRGTAVMSIKPMISRTFRISRPYSSLPSAKVRYFPPRSVFGLSSTAVFALLTTSPSSIVRCRRDQSRHVQDQAHISIAQDRAAADSPDLSQARSQRLDHHLLLSEQFVHEYAAAIRAVVHDHQQSLGDVVAAGVHVEQPMQSQHRHQVLAHH